MAIACGNRRGDSRAIFGVLWVMLRAKEMLDSIKLILSREPWWAEFWSAVASLFWVILSMYNEGATDKYYLYFQLSLLVNPQFWEFTGLLIGLFQMAALLLSSKKLRWAAAFLASWWWIFLSVSLFVNFATAPSLALYAVFACINLFSMIRLARIYA